jgi:hypothetical protein
LAVVWCLLVWVLARFFSLVGEEGCISNSVQLDRERVARGLIDAENVAPGAIIVEGDAEGSVTGGYRLQRLGSGMWLVVVGIPRGGAGIGNEKQFSGCCVAQLSASCQAGIRGTFPSSKFY